MTRLSQQEAGELAKKLIDAGKRGEPMPEVPACVPAIAAKDAYKLGQHYAALDAIKQ